MPTVATLSACRPDSGRLIFDVLCLITFLYRRQILLSDSWICPKKVDGCMLFEFDAVLYLDLER